MVHRRKGPSSKIPFQAKSRARTRTHLTFMSCVPTCPSHQCSDPQPHESSSGLLETHAHGLCVVTNSQENKIIDILILDFEFYMIEMFLVIHANTRSGLLTHLKLIAVLDCAVLLVTRQSHASQEVWIHSVIAGDSAKPSRLGDIH